MANLGLSIIRCTDPRREVAVTPEHAFTVFTRGLGRWWIRSHHVQTGQLKEIGIDPHVGGRMWEENDPVLGRDHPQPNRVGIETVII